MKKLLVSGEFSEAVAKERWEEIIAQCSQVNGALEYSNYVDLMQSYGILLSEYNIVRAWIMKLWVVVDNEIIDNLESKGYNIITRKDNPKYNPDLSMSENYRQSILNALKRSENIVTKIKMKESEMKLFFGAGKPAKAVLFDDVMAQLLVKGIKVEDNITLARYMAILKQLTTKPAEPLDADV